MDFLLYLDEILIKGLSSLIVEGYIEVRTRKRIWDRTLLGRLHLENKESSYCEDRNSKDKREGYKGYTNSDATTYTVGNDTDKVIEDRGFVRMEEEEKRIYTMFSFHQNIIGKLQTNNMLKNMNDVFLGNISNGDYVHLNGYICDESLDSYIDSLKAIIDCFGCDKLNTLLDEKSIFDFTVIDKFLTEIQNKLNLNNTCDMILDCGCNEVVLTLNNTYFLNNNINKLDNINCTCNVIGKVVKRCLDNDCIHFLRKTGQDTFYEEMLYKCIPVFDCLKKIGIDPPVCPRVKLNNNPYQIIPISIFI